MKIENENGYSLNIIISVFYFKISFHILILEKDMKIESEIGYPLNFRVSVFLF
jgi:hypothetical protein